MPETQELHPTLDPALLNNALSSLSPALEILERFHHRNKNQHRLSKWWAQADMLRRHVRKMLVYLDGAVEEAEKLARVRQRKTMKRKEGGGAASGYRDGDGSVDGNAEIRRRAEYLRWKLGPGAYLAFTQLSADRQFAHLGLMLLGVLAQVDAALAPFAPSPAADGEPPEDFPQQAGALGSSNPQEASRPSLLDQDRNTATDTDTDMGVAVSREDLLLMSIEQAQEEEEDLTRSKPTRQQSIIAQTPDEMGTPDIPSNGPAETRAASQSQGPARSDGGSEEGRASQGQGKQAEKKKEKKKKAGGDEFDDIFGSLETSRRPKKKKRKKGGDEFDDIFGSLL
ncbi:hypothetical protein VTK56DRAFT_5183 [Thermocarpiscus australiensis]